MCLITTQLEPLIAEGDTFLRISKYGHVFGIVKAISKQFKKMYLIESLKISQILLCK